MKDFDCRELYEMRIYISQYSFRPKSRQFFIRTKNTVVQNCLVLKIASKVSRKFIATLGNVRTNEYFITGYDARGGWIVFS